MVSNMKYSFGYVDEQRTEQNLTSVSLSVGACSVSAGL